MIYISLYVFKKSIKQERLSMKFVCPKCKDSLFVCESGSAKCNQNHTYDRARAGYYNLMLSGTSGTHGDNSDMVEARRAFLDTGAYFSLADRVSDIISQNASNLNSVSVLDIGCGEGYYTDIIERKLTAIDVSHTVAGFDISRDAVRRAAKRNKSIELAVAGAYHMPTADSSFDIAVNMFSPLVPCEILRTLKKDGIFIMAIPGENHLFALKKLLYATPYKNEVADAEIYGFELLSEEHLSYTMNLENQKDIQSLFMMTPYAYRTKPSDAERIKSMKKLECEADFVIFVYKKR